MTRRDEGHPTAPFDLRAFLQSDFAGSLEQVVRNILEHVPDAGYELARLAAFDFDREVSVRACAVLGSVFTRDGLSERAAARLEETALPALRELAATSSLPDERRFFLYSLLIAAGDELSPEMLASFQNLRAVLDRIADGAVEDVTDQPHSLGGLLFRAGLLEDEETDPGPDAFDIAVQMAYDVARTKPSAGAALAVLTAAVASEHGQVLDSVLSCLDSAAVEGGPSGAWWLRELSSLPTHPTYRAHARSLYQDMAAAGVEPAYVTDAEFSHGFATYTDGGGAQSLYLFFRRGTETDGLTFLLKDSVGIKDANLLPGAGEEIEALVRNQDGMILAPCTLALARQFLGDALARQAPERRACPGSFLLNRACLGQEPIPLERRDPDSSSFPKPGAAAAAKLLAESRQLADTDAFGVFSFHSDAAYRYAADLPIDGDDIPEEHLDEFIQQFAAPERPVLLRRLAANIEIELLAGHGRRKTTRMAAVMWRTLNDDTVPLAEIPYIRALAEESIWMAYENSLRGFASQDEADRAALEMEKLWFTENLTDDPWEFDDDEDDF